MHHLKHERSLLLVLRLECVNIKEIKKILSHVKGQPKNPFFFLARFNEGQCLYLVYALVPVAEPAHRPLRVLFWCSNRF